MRRVSGLAAPIAMLLSLACPGAGAGQTLGDSFGINVHFTGAGATGEADKLAATGARWIRYDLHWGQIETSQGAYGNWQPYDDVVAAMSQRNIKIIFILGYTNPLYDSGYAPYTDAGRTAFANFAAQVVSRYKGKGIVWEMWNEPNLANSWKAPTGSPSPNVNDYVKLAKAVGDTIRAVAPGESYVGPALANAPGTLSPDLAFLEECFRQGLLEYWSAVTVHPYRPGKAPETAQSDFQAIRELIADYAPAGKSIPIYSGEMGYSAMNTNGINEALQAKYFPRQILSNLAFDVPLSIWYDWRDDGVDLQSVPPSQVASPATSPNPNSEYHYGLIRRAADSTGGLVGKPSYQAAVTLGAQLNGFHFNKRLNVGNSGDFVLLFSNSTDSDVRVAAWSTSATPHGVTIPASAGSFTGVDSLGANPTAMTSSSSGLSLTLTDSVQYLAPTTANDLLLIAANWQRVSELIFDGQAGYSLQLTLKNPLSYPISVKTDSQAAPVAVAPGQSILFTSSPLDLLHQDKKLNLVLDWQIAGLGTISQSALAWVKSPFTVSVTPGGDSLPITVLNHTGRAFNGTLRLNNVVATGGNFAPITHSIPLNLSATDNQITVAFPLASETYTGPYHFGIEIDDETGNTVVLPPEMDFASVDGFSHYSATNLASSYSLSTFSNPSGASSVALSIGSPASVPASGMGTLRFAYTLGASSGNFTTLNPLTSALRAIPDITRAGSTVSPESIGFWAYNDGNSIGSNFGASGTGTRWVYRFMDATGQVFQSAYFYMTWPAGTWGYVTLPITTGLFHFNGANDGVIHYPINWVTPVMFDKAGSAQGLSGEAYFGAPTLRYPAPSNTTILSPSFSVPVPLPVASVSDGSVYPSLASSPPLSWATQSQPLGMIVDHYEYSLGSSPGANDVKDWTSAGTQTAAQVTQGLSLSQGHTYFTNVRVFSTWGTVSPVVSSDGWLAALYNLSYANPDAEYIQGQAIAPNTATFSRPSGTFSIDSPLPDGLNFDTATGTISGTPSVSWPSTSYLVTASDATGSASTSIHISVKIAPPSALSYASATAAYIQGQPIAPNSPSVTGQVASYSVSPALPSGLTIDTATGVISGTPTAVSVSASYIVTAANSTGSTSTTLTISVQIPAPSALSYSNNPASYIQGQAISPNMPTVSGQVTSYGISPPLPAGLALDAATGVISGTPSEVVDASEFTVTAFNSSGSTSQTLSIRVLIPPPVITGYTNIAPTYRDKNSYSNNAPVFKGPNTPSYQGTVSSWSVTPALPSGLTLDPKTGIIQGAPTAAQDWGYYTVTAANSTGSGVFTLAIRVWNGQFVQGVGTRSDPYIVADSVQLGLMRTNLASHFKLKNDLVLKGAWTPIGTSAAPFTGSLNGNRMKITGLSINTPKSNSSGLFGAVATTGIEPAIFDLSVAGNVTGSAFTGGIIGQAGRGDQPVILKNLSFKGRVTGQSQTGGIAGSLIGSISTSSSISSTVTGTSYVGGLLGSQQSGSTDDCYASGTVNGVTSVGGLIGARISGGQGPYETARNYVSTSLTRVSGASKAFGYIVSNIAFDPASPMTLRSNYANKTSTTPIPMECRTSAGSGTECEKKTGADLKKRATFVGWDFQKIWQIQENAGMPSLILNRGF